MSETLLDVWSDVVCPWCYIGRERLRQAMTDSPPIALRWRAFELQPDLPPEGVEARPFYARKFGGEARVEQLFAHVAGVAAQDGLRLDFAKARRAPNTRLGHRIVQLAESAHPGQGDAVAHALFRAHFVEGLDVARADVIFDFLASQAGSDGGELAIDLEALRARLTAGEGLREVLDDERMATELGIRGVPFFIAGLDTSEPTGLSGAQPVDVFRQFISAVTDG